MSHRTQFGNFLLFSISTEQKIIIIKQKKQITLNAGQSKAIGFRLQKKKQDPFIGSVAFCVLRSAFRVKLAFRLQSGQTWAFPPCLMFDGSNRMILQYKFFQERQRAAWNSRSKALAGKLGLPHNKIWRGEFFMDAVLLGCFRVYVFWSGGGMKPDNDTSGECRPDHMVLSWEHKQKHIQKSLWPNHVSESGCKERLTHTGMSAVWRLGLLFVAFQCRSERLTAFTQSCERKTKQTKNNKSGLWPHIPSRLCCLKQMPVTRNWFSVYVGLDVATQQKKCQLSGRRFERDKTKQLCEMNRGKKTKQLYKNYLGSQEWKTPNEKGKKQNAHVAWQMKG